MNAQPHDFTQSSPTYREEIIKALKKGLSPIPIRPGEKRPCIKNWQDYCQRPPTLKELAEWLTRHPSAGIGLALGTHVGSEKHLVAIDIDQDDLVDVVHRAIFGRSLNLGAANVSKRGAKGLTYFAVTDGVLPGRKFGNKAGMGVELLSQGQQAVIPPSIHPDGMAYAWTNDISLLDVDFADLPLVDQGLVDELKALVSGIAEPVNDNVPAEDHKIYLGDGHFEGFEMVYPGSVHDTQCRMAAAAARHDFERGSDNSENRDLAIHGMVSAARNAYERSGATTGWDDQKQGVEAASQYDSAMKKGASEWNWNTSSSDQPKSLKVIRPCEFQGHEIPERRWLVKPWIPHGYVTSLYGDGGMGKSMLAMQLMTACATGNRWLGLETTQCRTFGVFCEDDPYELQRRQDAINRHYGVEFSDLTNTEWVSRVGDDNFLMTFGRGVGKTTEIWKLVLGHAKKLDPELIVIDTAADTFGGDENARSQVRQYISQALGRFAREVDCSIVLCVHPSVRGLESGTGTGGSTAWNNSVRSRLYLKGVGDDDPSAKNERTLSRKKSNYGPPDDSPLRLVWQEGVFAAVKPPTEVEVARTRMDAQQHFLDCLDELTDQGQHLSTSKNASNYAPKRMALMPTANNLTPSILAQAMDELLGAKTICIVHEGPPSHTRQRIMRAEQQS